MTDQQTNDDIDAAEKQAALYDDDPREGIKTDVMNSFCSGIAYAREQSDNAAILQKAAYDGLSALFTEKVDELDALRLELEDTERSLETFVKIINGVCDALKGKPPELRRYSTHDLPEWATAAANVANAAMWLGAPGIPEHLPREDFVLALAAWKKLFAQQIINDATKKEPQ